MMFITDETRAPVRRIAACSRLVQCRSGRSPSARKSPTASATASACWRRWRLSRCSSSPRCSGATRPESWARACSRPPWCCCISTSTLFHALPRSRAKRVFQVLDHSAIYFLIAGTYTPFTLGVLRGDWGWTLFGLVWGMAVAGTVLKVLGGDPLHDALDLVYLAMGWLVVIAARRCGRSCRGGGSSGCLRAASPTRRARCFSWRNESATSTSSGTCSSSRAPRATSSRSCATRRDEAAMTYGFFSGKSSSAQARPTSWFGSLFPGIVAQPAFETASPLE